MNSIAELFFPPTCAACGKLLNFEGLFKKQKTTKPALCEVCTPLWKLEKEEPCGVCGNPVASCECVTKIMGAAGCKRFVKACYYCPGDFETVGNRMIYHIKDHASQSTVHFLAAELSAGVRRQMERPEWKDKSFLVTYLPRRRNAVRQTGTDQAKELAIALAQNLDLPLLSLIERKKGSNKPQKFLLPTQRIKNALDAFQIKDSSMRKGQVAILVDDIVTSGASMAAGVRLLRKLGISNFLPVAVASDECNKDLPVVSLTAKPK